MQDKETARVGEATPATGQTKIVPRKNIKADESAQRNSTIDPARLRYLARYGADQIDKAWLAKTKPAGSA